MTVRISFHAPTPYPYTAFVGTGVPVISRAQFADCVGAAAAGCGEENFAPLGAGPFHIVKFIPDELAVYERNPYYYGDAPYFEEVVLKGGGDTLSAAKSVMESGKADYAWNLQIDPATLANMRQWVRGMLCRRFPVWWSGSS